MISIQTKTHVGPDGTLTVRVPTTLRETDVDVMLVLQPMASPSPEALGWPPGFFEQTFGSMRDAPLERGPQGEYDRREAIGN